MAERLLGELATSVDAVHRLKRIAGHVHPFPEAVREPVHESPCFLREPEPKKSVEGEGRVPNPGVAVVPVALPADLLREARRRSGDDGPRRLVGEQLQRQSRPMHHLAPAPAVAGLGQPAAPVIDRPFVRFAGLPFGVLARYIVACYLLKNERDALAGLQSELAVHALLVAGDRPGGLERQAEGLRLEDDAMLELVRLVRVPGVVEPGLQVDAEANRSADTHETPDQLVAVTLRARSCDGHESLELPHAPRREETRYEDIRVREVELLRRPILLAWRNPVVPSFLLVEDRREDARRVEGGAAVPIDRPVCPDEGHRVEIPDDPVVADRQVVLHVALLSAARTRGVKPLVRFASSSASDVPLIARSRAAALGQDRDGGEHDDGREK